MCVMWQRGILGRKHKSERGCIPCDSHVTAGGDGRYERNDIALSIKGN